MSEEKLKAKIEMDTATAIRHLKNYQKALRDAGTETDKTKAATKDTNQEVEKTGVISEKAGKMVTGFVSGFAGLAGVKALISGVRQELEQTIQLRNSLLDTAVGIERLAQGIAQLRGDSTQAGFARARTDIRGLSMDFGVTPEVAERALFFGESQFEKGTPEAMAAARSTLRLAAPAGLQPQEVQQLPKLFGIMGARTEEAQGRITNKLNTAAGGSIATLGAFVDPFIGQVATMKERGFTLNQSLARMQSGIAFESNPAIAATRMEQLVAAASGRNKGSAEWWTARGQERGFDYVGASDPERLEFVEQVYNEFKSQGREQEIKNADPRGFKAYLTFFNPAATSQYEQAIGDIRAGGKSGRVERLFGEFSESSVIARAERQATQARFGEAGAGRRGAAQALLQRSAESIHGVRSVLRSGGEIFADIFQPKDQEIRGVRRALIRENLAAAFQLAEPGSAKQAQIRKLMATLQTSTFALQDEGFIGEVFDVTGGFTAPSELGRLAETTLSISEFEGDIPSAIGPGGQVLQRGGATEAAIQNFYGFTTVGSKGAALSPTTPQNPN